MVKKFSFDKMFEEIDLGEEFDIENKVKKVINENKTIAMIKNMAIEELIIGEHFHDWLEFSYMIEGEQELYIGNSKYVMSTGDFIMIDYNVLHSYVTRKQSRKITFQMKRDYIEHIFPLFQSQQIYCNSTNIVDIHSYYQYKKIIDLYLKMIDCFEKRTDIETVGFQGYMYLFFYELMNHFKKEDSLGNNSNIHKSNMYTQQILSYLHKHYDEDISLKGLAHVFHIAPDYISKIIRDELGLGYKEYLNHIRLNHAVYEMIHTDKTLSTISLECGFANNKSFIHAFKEKYQMTPMKYRKMNQK